MRSATVFPTPGSPVNSSTEAVLIFILAQAMENKNKLNTTANKVTLTLPIKPLIPTLLNGKLKTLIDGKIGKLEIKEIATAGLACL